MNKQSESEAVSTIRRQLPFLPHRRHPVDPRLPPSLEPYVPYPVWDAFLQQVDRIRAKFQRSIKGFRVSGAVTAGVLALTAPDLLDVSGPQIAGGASGLVDNFLRNQIVKRMVKLCEQTSARLDSAVFGFYEQKEYLDGDNDRGGKAQYDYWIEVQCFPGLSQKPSSTRRVRLTCWTMQTGKECEESEVSLHTGLSQSAVSPQVTNGEAPKHEKRKQIITVTRFIPAPSAAQTQRIPPTYSSREHSEVRNDSSSCASWDDSVDSSMAKESGPNPDADTDISHPKASRNQMTQSRENDAARNLFSINASKEVGADCRSYENRTSSKEGLKYEKSMASSTPSLSYLVQNGNSDDEARLNDCSDFTPSRRSERNDAVDEDDRPKSLPLRRISDNM